MAQPEQKLQPEPVEMLSGLSEKKNTDHRETSLHCPLEQVYVLILWVQLCPFQKQHANALTFCTSNCDLDKTEDLCACSWISETTLGRLSTLIPWDCD